MDLTDEQWAVLAPLLPRREQRRGRRGRPWQDARGVLNGVLWILRTGAPWADLPDRYPPYQTCHRRFQQWVRAGTWDHLLRALAADLAERGGLDLREGFIDATFAGAKKGAPVSGKPKRGKGTKIVAVADGTGLPLSVLIASASPHEVTLAEATLDACFAPAAPERLIGDRAYDSDALDQRLASERGIALIAPHRSNRRRPATQDGRPLRRYRRRWRIERLWAWLQNYRRLVTRYEHHAANFLGFVQLGCILILLRYL
ncbi:MAG: IS5 family transposase [Chloroflexi bacterium]|nr:IS5 family transposase [Chloroflexota bacterium]